MADEIVQTMTTAGYNVRETDPFSDRPAIVLPARETSPYVSRIRLLWEKMRAPVVANSLRRPGFLATSARI